MLASLLAGWFARPAECAAPRAPRPSAAAVQVEVSRTADAMVIRVKGEARAECAGALLDGLLAPGRRPAVVTLDLSELRSVSWLALGVLAAYRRCVVRTGGRVGLAGVLQPAVKESLVRAKLFDLFETSTAGASSWAPEIVDAAVMPMPPSANTNAAVVMIRGLRRDR
jgi:anti-anti-sigma regulatory factor